MTRIKYYLPLALFSLALAIALAAGLGLGTMQTFSTNLIDSLFAVPYRLEPRGEVATEMELPTVTHASVFNGKVLLTPTQSGVPAPSIDLNQVNLFSTSPEALSHNRLRAGLFVLLLLLLALLCSLSLVASGIALLEKNRRETTRMRQRMRNASKALHRPVPPNDPDGFPHAA